MIDKNKIVTEMDFLSDLLPAVPSLGLNPTSNYQNMTFIQNAFITTFITYLGFETVSHILGESAGVLLK